MREAPYLVVLLKVEVDVLRSLYEDVGELAIPGEAQALEVHRADAELLDAVGRYVALAELEMEQRVLAPTLLKEIHYRLLASPLGHMLRRLLAVRQPRAPRLRGEPPRPRPPRSKWDTRVPTQFSREYARKFGRPPSKDVESVRTARDQGLV